MVSQLGSLLGAVGNPVLPRVSNVNEVVEWILLAILLTLIVAWISGRITTDRDKAWLPTLVVWGFVAKMLGSLARYYMVAYLYAGGDAFGYHFQGIFLANTWRKWEVPVSSAGGEGTAFTEVVTGLIYAIYTPSMVGGFLMFAFLAFLGQLLFYAAFRPWLADSKLKLYAIAVLFLPSVVFWPSSIGKDALMTLFLGMAVYGASRLLATYNFSSLLWLAPGLFLASRVRPHVAALLALSIVLAAILGRIPKPARGSPKRLILIGLAIAGAAFSLASFSNTFGVTLAGDDATSDPGAFLDRVSNRTAQGGSEITGGAVGSITQLPGAIVTVLFRPLIHEGGELQIILSAMEGTALLFLTFWKLPKIWRNRRQLREQPVLLMAFFYTGGFIIAFSAILNLGIVARQRVQVLPLFIAVVIAMGWDSEESEVDARSRKRSENRRSLEPARSGVGEE